MGESRIDTRQVRAKALLKSLQELAQDLELQQSGYKIHYAVDFAELFLYAHPLSYVPNEFLFEFDENPKDDDRAQALARQRMTLTFGFDHVPGPLVLLPPYANELRIHLRSISRYIGRLLSEKNIALLEILRRRIIENLIKRGPIKEAVEKATSSPILTYDQKQYLVNILEENYRDIWTLLTIDPQGIRHVMRLIENKQIVLFNEAFPNLKLPYELVAQGVAEWFSLIREQPGRRERPYQNNIDAYACRYIYMINESIVPQKNILMIISHSYALQNVLTRENFSRIQNWPERLDPIRGLRYLHTRLLCAGLDDKSLVDEKRVYTFLRETEDFVELLGEMKRKGVENDPESIAEMTLMRELQNANRNISLFLKTDGKYLEEFQSSAHFRSELYDVTGISSNVLNTLMNNQEFKAELKARSNELTNQIIELNRRLASSIDSDIQTKEYIDFLQKMVRPGSQPIRIGADQFLYIPYLLHSFDTDIQNIVEQILIGHANEQRAETGDAIKVIREMSQSRLSSDSHLIAHSVLALIWLYIGEWHVALDMVMLGLRESKTGTRLWADLLLLRSLLERNLKTQPESIDKALEFHLKSMNGEEYSSRSLIELGIWSWIKYGVNSVANLAIRRDELLHEAINYIRKAYTNQQEENYLKMYLMNKLAYLLSQTKIKENVEEAEIIALELSGKLDRYFDKNITYSTSLIQTLENTIILGIRVALYDTRGCIYIHKGSYVKNHDDLLQEKRNAIWQLNQALTNTDYLLPWESRLIHKHMEEARRIG